MSAFLNFMGASGPGFEPYYSGISYKPLSVPDLIQSPKVDYARELDNIIKRSLFEGMI